jgi:hypothetical protein
MKERVANPPTKPEMAIAKKCDQVSEADHVRAFVSIGSGFMNNPPAIWTQRSSAWAGLSA